MRDAADAVVEAFIADLRDELEALGYVVERVEVEVSEPPCIAQLERVNGANRAGGALG